MDNKKLFQKVKSRMKINNNKMMIKMMVRMSPRITKMKKNLLNINFTNIKNFKPSNKMLKKIILQKY